jgi:hypothetical protein
VKHSGICKAGSEMSKKDLGQDSRHPDRDLKLRLPQYKAGSVTTSNREVVSLSLLIC